MCAWFSSFFENALVGLVKRRIAILIVRFARPTQEVPTLLPIGGAGDLVLTRPDAFRGAVAASGFQG